MIDLDIYVQQFYDEHGLGETKRRLSAFYGAFIELYEEYLPEVAKSAIEVAARHRKGEATAEELKSAQFACMRWEKDNGGLLTSPAHFAVRVAVVVADSLEDVTDDEEAHHALGMFLVFAERAADHSADVERYLRAAFESP